LNDVYGFGPLVAAEAILQVRAAQLSDGDPLTRFISRRPGQLHYNPPTKPNSPQTHAGE
jgi:hypothetical protein